MPATRILYVLDGCSALICPESEGHYHVASWVVLTSLEGEGEGVLSGWDERPSEVIEHVLEA